MTYYQFNVEYHITMLYRQFFIASLLMGLCLSLSGQSSAGPLAIHTDKNFYVNGEVIWYKLYLPASFKGEEAALRASVIDPNGQEMDYVFHKTASGGSVNGYYKIPFDVETGFYRLVFWGMQKEDASVVEIGERVLPIYNDNDIERLQAEIQELAGVKKPQPDLPGALEVSLRTESQISGPRAPVSVLIRVTDQAGNPVDAEASVAVTNWSLAQPALGPYTGWRAAGVAREIDPGSLKSSLFERAMVVDEEGNPRSAIVIGAWSGMENRMFYANGAGEDGLTLLELPDYTGEKTIQFIGYDKEVEDIITRDFRLRLEPITQAPPVTPGLLEYLERSRQRKKIFQYYGKLEFELAPAPQQLNVQELLPNREFIIDEYEDFENLATFFQEILTPLRFQEDRKNNRYTAQMYNPRDSRGDTRLNGRPTFIVNRQMTRNADFVGKLDLQNIEKVQLFYRPDERREPFKVFGNNGITRIQLKSADIPLPDADAQNVYRFSGIQREAAFPAFRPTEANQQQPFFRPQLFWSPAITINQAGQGQFEYFQSDAMGEFRIEVAVQDEQGRRGYATLKYAVKIQ